VWPFALHGRPDCALACLSLHHLNLIPSKVRIGRGRRAFVQRQLTPSSPSCVIVSHPTASPSLNVLLVRPRRDIFSISESGWRTADNPSIGTETRLLGLDAQLVITGRGLSRDQEISSSSGSWGGFRRRTTLRALRRTARRSGI